MTSVRLVLMGIKEKRTKILIALILLADVDFKYVNLGEKEVVVFDIIMNQKTRDTLASLIREGLIEKLTPAKAQFNPESAPGSLSMKYSPESKDNGYRLTEKGFYSLCLEFPFFRFLRDKWDGRWRILSYEIPEKKRELRDKLRREVSGWGLGPWHRSFWITPHPIIENLRQLVSQKEEEQYIQAFESKHVFGNKEVLIEKVWQKSYLDKKYRELFKIWHDILAKEGDKIKKFSRVILDYVTILRLDPGLPSELLGENWIGVEAFNIFKEIRNILLS